MGGRPEPTGELTAEEFGRWYWTKAELVLFARTLGVATGGSKLDLSTRIRCALAGVPAPVAKPAARNRVRGPLTPSTQIPAGVVLSRELRDWFTAQVGPTFRFNGHLREFLANGAGRTLGEAVDHYLATRASPPEDIAEQFEYNRFARAWRANHPDGAAEQMRSAWWEHRSAPTDARPTGRPPAGKTDP
jgi:hypothetical protein